MGAKGVLKGVSKRDPLELKRGPQGSKRGPRRP